MLVWVRTLEGQEWNLKDVFSGLFHLSEPLAPAYKHSSLSSCQNAGLIFHFLESIISWFQFMDIYQGELLLGDTGDSVPTSRRPDAYHVYCLAFLILRSVLGIRSCSLSSSVITVIWVFLANTATNLCARPIDTTRIYFLSIIFPYNMEAKSD